MDKIEFLKNIQGPEQKSEAWLELRGKYLTTSSYGSIFGVSKYSKPEDVLIEKCLPKGVKKNFSGSVATYHGEKYETEALDLYCKLMGKTNYEFGLRSWEEVNPIRRLPDDIKQFLEDNPHLRTDILACSVDGISIDNNNEEEPVLLEVKCPYRRKIINNHVPIEYMSQVQMNLWIMDIEKADFVEYIPPNHFGQPLQLNIVRVHRDHDYFKKHLVILNDFWKQIEYWRENDITKHPYYEKYSKDL